MGCGCYAHSKKGIRERKMRKEKLKAGIDRTKMNMKRKTCLHCEHMRVEKCSLGHINNHIDDILNNINYKCPLDYFK